MKVMLLAFAVDARMQRKQKGAISSNNDPSTGSATLLLRNQNKTRRMKGSKDGTCVFDPDNIMGQSVVQSDGSMVGCLETSDKYCGEKLRFIPEGDVCDTANGEVQVAWNQLGQTGPPGA